jgi:hypothetical protein
MATLDTARTSAFIAASRILDEAIDAAIDGAASHASGTTFVPAHLAATGHVGAYRRLGPVTIVDADGNELRLARDRTLPMLIAASAAVLLVAMLLGRRGRALV